MSWEAFQLNWYLKNAKELEKQYHIAGTHDCWLLVAVLLALTPFYVQVLLGALSEVYPYLNIHNLALLYSNCL